MFVEQPLALPGSANSCTGFVQGYRNVGRLDFLKSLSIMFFLLIFFIKLIIMTSEYET